MKTRWLYTYSILFFLCDKKTKWDCFYLYVDFILKHEVKNLKNSQISNSNYNRKHRKSLHVANIKVLTENAFFFFLNKS